MPKPFQSSYQQYQNRNGMTWGGPYSSGGYGGFGSGGFGGGDAFGTAMSMMGMGGMGGSQPQAFARVADDLSGQGTSFNPRPQMNTGYSQANSAYNLPSRGNVISGLASIPSPSTDHQVPPYQTGPATQATAAGQYRLPGVAAETPQREAAYQQRWAGQDRAFDGLKNYMDVKSQARVANNPAAGQYAQIGQQGIDPFTAAQNQTDAYNQRQDQIGQVTQGGMARNWTGPNGLQTDQGIPGSQGMVGGQNAQVRSYGTIPMHPDMHQIQRSPREQAMQQQVQAEMHRVADVNRGNGPAERSDPNSDSYSPYREAYQSAKPVNSLPVRTYEKRDQNGMPIIGEDGNPEIGGTVASRANARQAAGDQKRWWMKNVFNYGRQQERLNSPSGLMGQAAQYDSARRDQAYGHWQDSKNYTRQDIPFLPDQGPGYNIYAPSVSASQAQAEQARSNAFMQGQMYNTDAQVRMAQMNNESLSQRDKAKFDVQQKMQEMEQQGQTARTQAQTDAQRYTADQQLKGTEAGAGVRKNETNQETYRSMMGTLMGLGYSAEEADQKAKSFIDSGNQGAFPQPLAPGADPSQPYASVNPGVAARMPAFDAQKMPQFLENVAMYPALHSNPEALQQQMARMGVGPQHLQDFIRQNTGFLGDPSINTPIGRQIAIARKILAGMTKGKKK